jgi:oligopeptide transport system ATP-binding protein
MYAGRIVERSRPTALFEQPIHPYSDALLNAICRLDDDVSKPIAAIPGQPPLPESLPPGCPFHPRCPRAFDRCTSEEPVLHRLPYDRLAACHLAEYAEAVPS